ncbi:hypothetical protein BZG13_11730 [Salinivibrio sp. ML323]|uniref:hypothetical protein n=1 Tax=Salinivibrio sp. ML323 TaxID=1909474 RepID=UPI000985E30E|nr:hypothetical protein [Salinivibrio sp. ML323]OOE57248.1 hypothetical protein BZG13_11730 [Salinivibrio sp. ML323]
MSHQKTKPFAFVLMPFSSEFEDVYKLGIKEASENCDVLAQRLDEQLFNEGMLDRIYRQIDVADFVIADLSDRNPNVFYELGYAHARDKIYILLTKNADDIPFDLKHRRHVVYGDSISYLKSELEKNIEWAKAESEARTSSKIQVDVKPPTGYLSNTEHLSEAIINFTIDLHNKTNKYSPEISATYLYAGNDWRITQEGKDCPFSEADIKPFKRRYLITPPASKLGAGGWSQIRLQAKRVIARAWNGDEIPDSTNIGGRGIIRLETTDGNYDHEFDFNLELSDIPF